MDIYYPQKFHEGTPDAKYFKNQTISHCEKMELVGFDQNCSNLPHRMS